MKNIDSSHFSPEQAQAELATEQGVIAAESVYASANRVMGPEQAQAAFDKSLTEPQRSYTDYVLVGTGMVELATEIKDERGVIAAGPVYASAAEYFNRAISFRPIPSDYDPFTELVDPIDPFVLLQHGNALAKQLEAWYLRPYSWGPLAHPDTLNLTIVDRRLSLERVALQSLTQAWEGIHKAEAEIKDIGMTGILAADGLISLDRLEKANDIAEETGAMLDDHNEDIDILNVENS